MGCDFSGFFTEVVGGFLPFLLAQGVPITLLQQPTCSDYFIREKLTPSEASAYQKAQMEEVARPAEATRRSIAIEHAEPCKMRRFSKQARPRWVISRSMTEGVLQKSEAKCIAERADEVWVPAKYHVRMFANAGVPRGKLYVIPEAVPTDFFNPTAVNSADKAARRSGSARLMDSSMTIQPYIFFSVFKWEPRKGWDVLLTAYWSEFERHDPVILRLRSYVPHWEPGPHRIRQRLQQHADGLKMSLADLPRSAITPQ